MTNLPRATVRGRPGLYPKGMIKMSLTKEKLERFVRIRNASEFDSNLQVQCDASECGFSVDELGAVEKVGYKHAPTYRWRTPFGLLEESRDPSRNPIWSLRPEPPSE